MPRKWHNIHHQHHEAARNREHPSHLGSVGFLALKAGGDAPQGLRIRHPGVHLLEQELQTASFLDCHKASWEGLLDAQQDRPGPGLAQQLLTVADEGATVKA